MDYGLLGGLAQGINAGLDSYKSERDYVQKKQQMAQEKAMKDKAYKIQLMSSGIEETPEGDFRQTDAARKSDAYGKAIQGAGLLKSGYSIGDYDQEKNQYAVEKLPGFRDLDDDLKRSQINKNNRSGGEDTLASEMKQERLSKMKRDSEDSIRAQSPAGKLEKAGGEIKTKIGFITSALKNVTDYEKQFRDGGRQSRINSSTPLIGSVISSTPIDEARSNIEEALGRLASGGAINGDELKKFTSMLPRAADDDASAARKLQMLRTEMENKLTGYGFKTDDLKNIGYNPEEYGYGTEFSKMEGRGLLQDQKNKKGLMSVPDAYAAAQPQAPKVGYVEGGFEFQGGDAANPNSWKKVQ